MNTNTTTLKKSLQSILSETEYDRAVSNLIKQETVSGKNPLYKLEAKVSHDGAESLLTAFCWQKSKEGFDYWLKIFNRIKPSAPPIPDHYHIQLRPGIYATVSPDCDVKTLEYLNQLALLVEEKFRNL